MSSRQSQQPPGAARRPSAHMLPPIRDVFPAEFATIPGMNAPPQHPYAAHTSPPVTNGVMMAHARNGAVPTTPSMVSASYAGQMPPVSAATSPPRNRTPAPPGAPAAPPGSPQSLPLGIDAHTCPICGRRFDRPSTMRIHANSHTGDKPYTCTVCGRAYTCSSNLYRHQRRCDACAPGRDQQTRNGG